MEDILQLKDKAYRYRNNRKTAIFSGIARVNNIYSNSKAYKTTKNLSNLQK